MELITVFGIAGVTIFIGFFAEWIFDKTSIPDVIWLTLLGLVFGQVFNITSSAVFKEIAPIFTTFALIFILFDGAINIDIKKLLKGVSEGGTMALTYFCLCLIVITIAMMTAGWGFWQALLLATVLGGISSDVIIPLTKRITIKPETALDLTLESAISDVLSIVGAVTILNLLILEFFSLNFMIQRIVYSFGIGIFIGTIFGLLWVKIQNTMNKFSKSYMTTIAAVLLLYSFVEYLESNGAIACLTFGIILGNSNKIFSILDTTKEYKVDESEKFFFSEISFFVKTFFFVYLGLLINFENLWLILLGFLITLILYFIRPLAYLITYRNGKFTGKDRSFIETMMPKGLAAAVLAQLPMKYGFVNAQGFSLLVIYVIMFSILLSTIGVFIIERYNFKGLTPYLDIRNIFYKKPKLKEGS